jgi:hypothetical protein
MNYCNHWQTLSDSYNYIFQSFLLFPCFILVAVVIRCLFASYIAYVSQFSYLEQIHIIKHVSKPQRGRKLRTWSVSVTILIYSGFNVCPTYETNPICCCAEWYVSLIRDHDWLTNEILFILFGSIKLDLMHTNLKVDAHQRCKTFGERRIRINIVPHGTETNISPLVPAMISTKCIARYIDGE